MHGKTIDIKKATPFPLADANGNCVSYIDNAGNVQAHYTYDAFGGTVSQSDDNMADVFRFRFSSKYLDEETGLYYYGYRWYDAALGRWISRDPISDIAMCICYDSVQYLSDEYISSPSVMANLYQFNENAPVFLVDIIGLLPFDYFTIKFIPSMPTPFEQSARAAAPEYRDGFEVDYWPADDCPCNDDDIRLVQAIRLGNGRRKIDTSDALIDANKSRGIPLPGYREGTTAEGISDESIFAYRDAPYSNATSTYGIISHFEVCAICRKEDGTDKILGCFTFDWTPPYLDKDGSISPGDVVRIAAPAPTKLWQTAAENWKQEALKKKGKK